MPALAGALGCLEGNALAPASALGGEAVMAFQIARAPTAFENDRPSKKDRRIEDPAHLAFIRKLPSVVSGAYGCEACHIRAGNNLRRKKRTGMQQKPDDFWTLPLTPAEHRQQHSENEIAFWERHGIDPFDLAERLYEVTGDMPGALAVIRSVRAQQVEGGRHG